jgi:putative Ca2+/H+ antiporter (TMEM165/GDT1 family)
VNIAVIASVFPLILIAELPDKTMFASLLMASRGRPMPVWVGACLAFAVHVVIAVSVGVALFELVPHRVLDGVVAAMFAGGAIYALASRGEEDAPEVAGEPSAVRVAATAATVIFVAEWGDLTQILTANLAAAYHDAWSVGTGAISALMAAAAIAVVSGSRLVAAIPVRQLRLITAVVLAALAAYEISRVF